MKSMIWIILSGILIAVSLPGYFIPFSFVFGFIILLNILKNASFKETIYYSFITGFVFSLLAFYWTVYAITYYGGVSIFLGIPLLFLLAATFSIFQFVSSSLVFYFLKRRYGSLALLAFPFIWVFFEILREFIPFGGFPWNLIGYTLSYFNSIAQITSIFSVYFLSFLAVFIPSIIFFSYQKGRYSFVFSLVFVSVLILSLHFWGVYRGEHFNPEGINKKVAIVQANITEDVKLQNKEPLKVIDKYINLIKKAYKKNPDLIVLPESALPFFFIGGDEDLKNYFLNNISDVKVPILLGSDTAIFKRNELFIYNSILLLDENKNIVDIYNKIKLVPFGEYVPFPFKIFSSIFPYLEGYDFSSGKEKKILSYKEWKIVPLICFEGIFPNFVADFSKKGNVIVNISNDAWFGKTVAPYQHFEMARIRAIENGLYLIRGTNTGISAVITPIGTIKSKLGLFKEGVIVSDIKLIRTETIWKKYHTLLTIIYVILLIILLIIFEIKKGKKKWLKKLGEK